MESHLGCLTFGVWQMLLPMWLMESQYDEWQMLIAYCGWCYCHCNRWNSHMCWYVSLWQMLSPLWQMEWPLGQCICCYFNLSFVMLFRTSSHIWGSWYLAYVSVQGWIIKHYVYSFFNQPQLVQIWKFILFLWNLNLVQLYN